jgi:hypothetical protein
MDQLSNEVRQKLATVRPETLVCEYLYLYFYFVLILLIGRS